MKEIMGITDMLCQALQKQNQDVVSVMYLVRSTKSFIQDFRENGWDILFTKVRFFCENMALRFPILMMFIQQQDLDAPVLKRIKSQFNITLKLKSFSLPLTNSYKS